jgi:LCP family protein required for cell wall assembly
MGRGLRRTWPQRLVLGSTVAVACVCLMLAVVVWWAGQQIGRLHGVTLVHAPPSTVVAALSGVSQPTAPSTSAPSSASINFLLTGSDSRSCIDPSSPYAGAFLGAGASAGARSDTIMLLHVDPATTQAALLSFPRDLWVPIAGTSRKDRINSAFRPDDPSQLVQTIETDFGIRVDHYVGVDFCAFKNMVDAVGGIQIPFVYPTRDTHTGLNITQPGCVKMSGDEALAYVRSRYYEYQAPDGVWHSDTTSDYGRIARQQDFIRRVLRRAFDRGATNPVVAKQLLDIAVSNDVHIDGELTFNELFQLGRQMRNLNTTAIERYRFDGTETVIGGADVIVPTLNSPTNQAIEALFRGQAPAASPSSADSGGTAPGDSGSSTTLPADNPTGIYPPDDPSCT